MDFNKYLTNRNVALLGTITFHVIILAIFTHINLGGNSVEKSPELVISFVETVEDQKEVEEIEEEQVDDSTLDYDDELLTNAASNESSKNSIQELRASMKSLDGLNSESEEEGDDIDLFSESAKNRKTTTKLSKKEEEKQGKGESERKVENAYTGKSTINYYLENRYSDKLPNPIYTCINGGKIRIDITVNTKGNVVSTSYNKGKSTTNDECLVETATKYAKMAKFNSDFSSKSSQKGYITYSFKKQ